MALYESDVSTCKPYIIKELLLLWSLSQRTTVLYLIKAENVFSTLYKNEKLASVFVKFKLHGKRGSRELRKSSASLTWETDQLFGSHGCFRAICLPISWLTFLLLALHETVHMTSSSSSSSWCPCKTNRGFLVTIFIKNIIFGIEVGLWFVHSWELFPFLPAHPKTALCLQQLGPLSSVHLIFHYVFIVFCPSNWTEKAARGF